MRAQIVSIGSELIQGDLTDTNATFLAQELAAHGIELLRVTQVGDNRQRITAVLREAAAESDLVACSGGIGPTEDDLTREAMADLAGQTPQVDPVLLRHLREHFASRGQVMPERNAKQAWRIPAVEILPNPIGSAPGWLAKVGPTRVVAMPGVPREMKRMWREQALPRILTSAPDRYIRSTTLKTIGIGESSAEELMADLVAHDNPVVATYAKDDGVQVRITAVAGSEREAAQERDQMVTLVRSRLGDYIYATDDETLAEVLARRLRQRHLTLGIIDQGSGGQLAALLSSTPLAAGILVGTETMLLPAASQRQSARELAAAAVSQFDADLGLGLTSALADQGDDVYLGQVTVALVGALTMEVKTAVKGGWQDIQRRASLAAAAVLLKALGGKA